MHTRCEKKKKRRNRRKRACKRVHCPITCPRCSSTRFILLLFFYSKNAEHAYGRATDVHTYATATVLWTRADVTRRQTFQGSPRLSRGASTFPFHVSLLSLLFLLYTRTGCSVEITVVDTVGSLNLRGVSLALIFNIISILCHKRDMPKKRKKERRNNNYVTVRDA